MRITRGKWKCNKLIYHSFPHMSKQILWLSSNSSDVSLFYISHLKTLLDCTLLTKQYLKSTKQGLVQLFRWKFQDATEVSISPCVKFTVHLFLSTGLLVIWQADFGLSGATHFFVNEFVRWQRCWWAKNWSVVL
jgi:hypothetical protein